MERGVQTQVTDTISSIGSNLFVVWPQMQTSNRVKCPEPVQSHLTLDDATELKYLDEIEEVASVIAKSFQVQFQEINWNARVSGISPAYNEVRDWNLVYGSYISEQDMKSSDRIAVIGLDCCTRTIWKSRCCWKSY